MVVRLPCRDPLMTHVNGGLWLFPIMLRGACGANVSQAAVFCFINIYAFIHAVCHSSIYLLLLALDLTLSIERSGANIRFISWVECTHFKLAKRVFPCMFVCINT